MESPKEILKGIFSNDILFNKDFEDTYDRLKKNMQLDFLGWCRKIVLGEVAHIPITIKRYRNFVLFINKIGEKRAIVVKEKNTGFMEAHLSGHRYYDEQRKRFGLKMGSKYY